MDDLDDDELQVDIDLNAKSEVCEFMMILAKCDIFDA